MATDILQLLFNDFLRINPSTVSQYATPQLQLLNLFFIPHVILFLFIYGFAWIITPTHKGFRYLISIAAYLTLVLTGTPYSIYSTLLPLLLFWWQLALGIGLFFFIAGRIVHPSKAPELFNIGKSAISKLTAKDKQKRAIEEEIDSIKRQIQELEAEANNPGREQAARAYSQSLISNLKAKKKDLESRL